MRDNSFEKKRKPRGWLSETLASPTHARVAVPTRAEPADQNRGQHWNLDSAGTNEYIYQSTNPRNPRNLDPASARAEVLPDHKELMSNSNTNVQMNTSRDTNCCQLMCILLRTKLPSTSSFRSFSYLRDQAWSALRGPRGKDHSSTRE